MIGLLKKEFAWLQILEQEGILYQMLDSIPDQYDYPFIINRCLMQSELPQIQKLLNQGVCILTDMTNLKKIKPDLKYTSHKNNYLLNDGTDIFNNITAIDYQYTGYDKIYESDLNNGYIIAIPFNINQALLNIDNERKPFYYPSRKFPNEITAQISKADIRKLVVNCIRKLYQKMNLSYCHLWYYPNQTKSAFAFRVDTDFGPESSLQATFDLADKTGIKFTYFVNTKAHPVLANNKRDFQIHCYQHEVYKDYRQNYDNISKAKSILEKSGISPIGFVSPYGLWNENLHKAMEDNNIKYSSEFSLAYDDLPFFPVIENRQSNVLQVPVHPICIGRLVHAGLSQDQCLDYYQKYFTKQRQANEPIFIYDHPHRIAQFPDIFDKILTQAKQLPDIWLTNMTEFYHWWQNRLSALQQSQWHIQQDQLHINTQNQTHKIFLHVITPDRTEAFIPLQPGIYNLKDFVYKNITKPIMDKTEIANYPKLKSRRTRMQINFYQCLDKILKLLGK
jgi:hypothetical protein